MYSKRSSEEMKMPPYLISQHIHLCETGGHVVFLDLRRDKYLAIRSEDGQSLIGRVEGWPANCALDTRDAQEIRGSDSAVIQSMLDGGLLTENAAKGKRATPPDAEAPRAMLIDDDFVLDCSPRATHMLSILLACGRASTALRVLPFEWIVNSVRSRKEKSLAKGYISDREKDRQLVAIFNRLRPFILTQRDKCLLDSLALIEFLAQYRSFPNWVLGVKTGPFGAHSWVQDHDMLFNGPLTIALAFTPILVV